MKRLFFILALLLAAAAPASAQGLAPAQGMKVHARLVAQDKAVAPGGTTTIALVETIAPGWHTYWKNPGDAGAPTRIQWTLPDGWSVDPIQWPRPKRLPVGPLMDYGYEGTVWLPMTLHAPKDARAGDMVTLRGHATWLVCSNICIPESGDVSMTLPVGPQSPDPSVAGDFAAAHAQLPVLSPWNVSYALDEAGKALDLYVAAPALAAAHPAEVDFFPAEAGTIENAAPQQVGYAKDGLVLRLKPSEKFNGALNGLLVLKGSDGSIQALDVSAEAGPVPPAVFEAPAISMGGLSLWLAVGFALLGGLILNVMPCVLPILAMKALAVARHGAGGRGESFAYAGGAVISFAALGLLIVALRAGGTAVGWGFQLQNPVAVGGFALLIFAVGLNLSGVFEVGTITAGDRLARGGGLVGAFFTGVLAVAVAAPCTAPFMAAALGFALTQSAVLALAVFVALGVGFALPFLILGVWPRALAFLPKPGPWMMRLKQFLAFPMYAASVWLVWVLAQQVGPSGVAIVLGAFVALALAAWLWGVVQGRGSGGRLAGGIAALAVVVLALYGVGRLAGLAVSGQAQAAGQVARLGEPYSAATLAQYRQAGRPVFVDATAAWCITCLVNEEAVLSQASVKDAFAKHNVAYLVADWTNQDPAVTKLLKDNGRPGVPMYLYYAPGAERPRILPQLLTASTVLAAING